MECFEWRTRKLDVFSRDLAAAKLRLRPLTARRLLLWLPMRCRSSSASREPGWSKGNRSGCWTFDPQAAAAKNTSLQTGFLRRVLEGLKRIAGDQVAVASLILLCGSPARYHLGRMLDLFIPRIVVLSPGEIPAVVSVQSIGVVQ